MRLSLYLFLFCLVICSAKGQSKTKPIRVLLVNPESIQLADSLMVWADSIEHAHRAKYYGALRSMQRMIESGDPDFKDSMKRQLEACKLREQEVIDFKYYQMITNLTFSELSKLLQTKDPDQELLDGVVLEGTDINLRKEAKHYKADYAIVFDKLRNGNRNGIGTLSYSVTVFKRGKNLIGEEDIEGNARLDDYKRLRDIFTNEEGYDYYHESEVNCENYLECMFKSAVRVSTEKIFYIILKDEKK